VDGRHPGSMCPADAGDLRRHNASLNPNRIERRAERGVMELRLSRLSCSCGAQPSGRCGDGR
jgi:hypothetical protein